MAVPCKQRIPKYSESWAKQVVNRVYEKYPRARYVVGEGLGLTYNNLVTLLRCADPAWPIIRDMIKNWHVWCEQQRVCTGYELELSDLAWLMHRFVSRGEHSFQTYLKLRKIAIESKSREQRGVPPDGLGRTEGLPHLSQPAEAVCLQSSSEKPLGVSLPAPDD